jgi:hypothetical protein
MGHRSMREMRRLLFWTLLAVSVSFATESDAQEYYRGTDRGGLQGGRAYYSPSDWEFYDTKTGNLVLTFTDLILPGYSGQDLKFQRTYNNQPLPGQSGPPQGRWTFGFPGMPMRVVDPDWDGAAWHAPGLLQFGTFEDRLAHTPYLIMADGSRRAMMPDWDSNSETVQPSTVYSSDFLTMSRVPDAQGLRHVSMPNGVICDYDANGWLVHFVEAHGNHVWLDRSVPYRITITQAMGTEVRTVVEDLNGYNWVTSMAYDGRTWSYAYDGDHMDVTPPAGPGWHFEWDSEGTLSRVRLPLGGYVSYTYANKTYGGGAPFTFRVLTDRWMWPGIPSENYPIGRWVFAFEPGYGPDEPLSAQTFITTPSGVVHRYEHFTSDPGPITLGPGTGPAVETIERGADYYWLNRLETTYSLLQFRQMDANGGVARPVTIYSRRRELDSLEERTSTTTIDYRGAAGLLFHLPMYINETVPGEPTRTTRRD